MKILEMTKQFIVLEVKRNRQLMGLKESQEEIDFFGDEEKLLKTYVKIEDSDDDPKNLKIEYLNNNWRFSQFLNKILYEVYQNNLGPNQDNSKIGIIDIYPINNKSNWSILNYFGGHKYIKQDLLSLFNEKNKEENKTPKDFYKWILMNKIPIFSQGNILNDFIKTNMYTFNKGSHTENFVLDILSKRGFDIKFFPPGSKSDRDYGIDLEINGKTFQVKQLFEVSEDDENYYLLTPLPKNYIGLPVEKIMLVRTTNGDYISFPNKNYTVDEKNSRYVIPKQFDEDIKLGNLYKS